MKTSRDLFSHEVKISTLMRLILPFLVIQLSVNFMRVLDRYMLSEYSVHTMNAVHYALSLCSIMTEPLCSCAYVVAIFVGRYNGSGQSERAGGSVWQMMYLAMFLSLILYPLSPLTRGLLYIPAEYVSDAMSYQVVLLRATGVFIAYVALASFFFAIGNVAVVMMVSVLGNILNYLFNKLLIFGCCWIPSLGAEGAALSTVISTILQIMCMLAIFFRSEYREKFGVLRLRLNIWKILRMMKIGIPLSLGHAMYALALFVIYQIGIVVSNDLATLEALGSMIFGFFIFFAESLCKTVSTYSANLIGSGDVHAISRMVRKCLLLQGIVCAILAVPMLFCAEKVFDLSQFSHSVPHLKAAACLVLRMTWVSIALDGASSVFYGVLTAGADIRFLLFNSMLVSAILVLPIVALFYLDRIVSIEPVLYMFVISGVVNLVLLIARYRKGRWLHKL